jgi:beta-lactamase regulating signal transducer with metallopeptidase domain
MIDAAIARVLVEASLRVVFVALAVAGVLALARVQSSTVRHAAWTSVVVAMLLMPFLPYAVPSFELPAPSRVATTIASVPDELPFVGEVDLNNALGAYIGNTGRIIPPPSIEVTYFPEGDSVRAVADPSSRIGTLPLWLIGAAGIYAMGLGMLLVRWALAARFIARLRRQSQPIATPVAVDVFESPLAATPMAVGIFSPWIVLPTDWRSWSPAKLAGVLAHERAHVERRDPLIAIVAYVNRCIFWFHPLAWWLERKLAATAEDAADEAGVRAMGEERQYAEVLLDMAAVVRRHGGRVAWEGVGVDGNGLLGRRIDRLMSGQLFREVSRMKKIVIGLVSAAAVFVAVACRPQVEAAPLKPDPKVAEQIAANKARYEKDKAAREMTPAQIDELKAAIAKAPDDLTLIEKMLTFYRQDYNNPMPANATEIAAARRPYILSVIKNHPDSELAGSWSVRIFPEPTDPLPDRQGYAAAKALWLAHAARPDVPVVVLRNAATFFEAYDRELSEQMLLKIQAREPGTALAQLGRLYGLVISGAYGSTPLNVVRFSDTAHAHSALANRFRETLQTSNDAVVLSAACAWLTRGSSSAKVDFDPRELGRAYCQRAVQIDPSNVSAVRQLAAMAAFDKDNAFEAKFKDVPIDQRYEAVATWADAERFDFGPRYAEYAYMNAEYLDYTPGKTDEETAKRKARAKEMWVWSDKMANDLLQLAPRFTSHPDYAMTIYRSHLVLGTNALRKGDVRGAVAELRTSVSGPKPASAPTSNATQMEQRLVDGLIHAGERESIIDFLEKSVAFKTPEEAKTTLDAAAALTAGIMPMRYQYMLDREARIAAGKVGR